MVIEQIYTDCLAEAAYYIESNGEAAIIDPLRDTGPYLEKAEERGVKIKYIFETHFHADFVSGHLDLAHHTGAPIIYGPGADTQYDIYQAGDGEEFAVGDLKIKVLHTPGHTLESSCFLLFDKKGNEHAIFTGDTLFIGDVGRPDLLDGKVSKEELAGLMYDSLRNKIIPLPDKTIVYPAHGPGSACGKNIGTETVSTLGEQKKYNYALQPMTKEQFIAKVTEGILPPPQYFFKDAMINKQGYNPLSTVIESNLIPLSVNQFEQEILKGALILDTREPQDFERCFIKGAINVGLNGRYAVWVGTLIDINQPLILVTDPGKEYDSVMRLARVGYEQVTGYLEGGIESWINKDKPIEKIKSINFNEMGAYRDQGYQIIDVRRPGEYETSHLKGAIHYSLADFGKEIENLDREAPYLIHCVSGYRSMIATSIMKSKGFTNPVNVYGFDLVKSEFEI